MALDPAPLSDALATRWMAPPGGDFPGSAIISAQRFAGAVSGWFALAQANGIPCATAGARESGLAAAAAGALSAMDPRAAATLLALAVASYCAGQSFGAGVASFPLALPAAQAALLAVFSDTGMPPDARADRIAAALHALAVSTPVIFPPPAPPAVIV